MVATRRPLCNSKLGARAELDIIARHEPPCSSFLEANTVRLIGHQAYPKLPVGGGAGAATPSLRGYASTLFRRTDARRIRVRCSVEVVTEVADPLTIILSIASRSRVQAVLRIRA